MCTNLSSSSSRSIGDAGREPDVRWGRVSIISAEAFEWWDIVYIELRLRWYRNKLQEVKGEKDFDIEQKQNLKKLFDSSNGFICDLLLLWRYEKGILESVGYRWTIYRNLWKNLKIYRCKGWNAKDLSFEAEVEQLRLKKG